MTIRIRASRACACNDTINGEGDYIAIRATLAVPAGKR